MKGMVKKLYKLKVKDKIINYTINKKVNKKNISLYVKYPDVVTLTAPISINDDMIHDFVNAKSNWILNKIEEFKAKSINSKKFIIKDKSFISYFGNEYEVNIIKKNHINSCSLQVYNNKFMFDIPCKISDEELQNMLSSLLISFFIKQGSLDVEKRITIYSKKLGVSPNTIKVNNKKTSWGSCTSSKNIYINYRLLLAPIDIIDYVLVHELCHLKEMNHSSDFWNLVESIIPDYKEKKEWLKINGLSLIIS